MMDRQILYEILYATAALDGRGEALFGGSAPRAAEAFARSLPGDAMPEVWFEIPLSGEPRFDLHLAVGRETLRADRGFPPETCGGRPELFEWFARQGPAARQMVLSWDLNTGEPPVPGFMLLAGENDPGLVGGFLRAAGRGEAEERYRAFAARLPEEWFPCYSGVFPGRPGSGLRVECIPGLRLQQAYAEDPELMRRHLEQAGFTALGDTLIPRCRTLAGMPFVLEFQFDIGEGGVPGPVIGVSLRFACPPGGEHCRPFSAAGPLMEQIAGWSLADDRRRLLGDTAFARQVRHGDESRVLFCYPAYVKLRWRDGEPEDAKAYLVAGAENRKEEPR